MAAEFFRNRLPKLPELLPVCAVIAFMIYSWTFGVFLWRLPSWLYFLTIGEILAIFCYAMTASLVESLAFLGLMLVLCLLLPVAWWRRDFGVRGATAACVALVALLLGLARYAAQGTRFLHVLVPWSLAGLVAVILFTYLSVRIRRIALAAAAISDRLIVFLYIFAPVSAVSIIVVLFRNLP